MTQTEKQFFLELCKWKQADETILSRCLELGADTPAVLGQLFYNRMAGVAYTVLQQFGLLSKTHREFRTALKNAWLQNKEKNESYFQCLQMLNEVLKSCKGKYAMLKGAYLCKWYPQGCRTSNDVDLLVDGKDVSVIGEALEAAGFRQGAIRNEQFVPATRQEIIMSRMTRGETVPYIKEVNLPFFKYLEVDVNFSPDYKQSKDPVVGKWIAAAKEVKVEDVTVTTLQPCDFFLHLCQHLYKEATTYPWVEMKRDMTLYKFCDIYSLVQDWTAEDWKQLVERTKESRMEAPCYYALSMARELFALEGEGLEICLGQLAPKDARLLHRVIYPKEKKNYYYTQEDVTTRFFAADRTKLLKEGEDNAQITYAT